MPTKEEIVGKMTGELDKEKRSKQTLLRSERRIEVVKVAEAKRDLEGRGEFWACNGFVWMTQGQVPLSLRNK